MSNRKHQTMVVWEGISALDNVTPIVVLASFKSSNVKTGDMVQTWILRADVKPSEAIADGSDAAVCGGCVHRGNSAERRKRTCYVNMRTPNSVYGAYVRGNVRPFDPSAFAGRKVRLGAYGDPGAVPTHVWATIASVADGVTGYTHQWRDCDASLAEFCMASCDTIDDYVAARRAGWRGFVVRPLGAEKPKGLVQCPATAGKDNTVQCITCMQCGGNGNGRKASISIEVHGVGAKNFLPLAVV
ncbi:hypothetical protein SEA_BRICOLE_161 [Mycobacterium phage Bricole]|uniref:Uncharacterized protein n=1 Tax=Mycobacterium phage Bricole TaxID=1718601 RepID=A0A0M4R2L2_9CAUD|nr:hypothetical protein SEA_BRICOLE_161 [Mycobacterium phage Bricole]